MPLIKSAKKRARQALIRRERNYKVRTTLKKAIKTVLEEVKAGKKKEAEKALSAAYKVIDTACKKNILHRNTAARRKSSLANKVAKVKA